MKAIRIHSYGDSGQLRVEEMPQPIPRAGEVLVRIQRAGVNPVDWKIRAGTLAGRQRASSLPITLGQDFAGEVTATSGEAAEYRPGDRVFGFAHGTYAEYATASVGDLARLPAAVSLEIGAALPTPGLTAYQLLAEAVKPRPGLTLLILGAAGAVGTLALQMARQQGAQVVAADLPTETGYLTQLGAMRVVDTSRQGWEKEVGAIEAVVDLVGGELQGRCYDLLSRGGVLATTVGVRDADAAERRGVRAIGFVMRRNAADLARVAELTAQGVLRPRIATVLPLTAAKQAQDMSQQGEARGKILLAA